MQQKLIFLLHLLSTALLLRRTGVTGEKTLEVQERSTSFNHMKRNSMNTAYAWPDSLYIKFYHDKSANLHVIMRSVYKKLYSKTLLLLLLLSFSQTFSLTISIGYV